MLVGAPPVRRCRSLSPSLMLDIALKAARAGGDAILPFIGQPIPTEYKSDDSPLTKADLASHHAIVAVLEAEETAREGVVLAVVEEEPRAARPRRRVVLSQVVSMQREEAGRREATKQRHHREAGKRRHDAIS